MGKFKVNIEDMQGLSLKSSRPSTVKDVDKVPIGNKKAYDILTDGDEDKAEFLTEFKIGKSHPAYPYGPDNPVIISLKWGRSYAAAINDNPKPMYNKGHEDTAAHAKMRIPSAGYVVGAILDKETDTLYLRNYYRKSETPEQSAIRNQDLTEMRAGLLSTSVAETGTEWKTEFDKKTGKSTMIAVKSLRGQSNALVEAHMTGGDATIPKITFKSGNADKIEKKPLRSSSMDEELKDMLLGLKNRCDLGSVSLKAIGDNLGITVLTTKDTLSLKRLETAEKKFGNLDEFITKYEAEQATDFISLKDAAMTEKFKEKKIIEQAARFFTLKEGNKADIDKHIGEIAEMEVIKEGVSLKASEGNLALGGSE